MSKRYFLKELVNNLVHCANGVDHIPFVHGADDMGHLELDTEKDAAMIKEIEPCIKARRGGIYEVQEDAYEAEKKKQPFSRLTSGSKHAPRLHVQKEDPFRSTQEAAAKTYARHVPAPVSAAPVEASSPAPIAAAVVTSDRPAFTPRRGAARKAK